MASELSRFIDEELLKDGKEGELAKLLARQNSQRSKARRPAFSGLCSPRCVCCLLIFGIVAAAVVATASQKDASKKVIGWAISKGRAPTNEPTPEDPGQLPFPDKEVGQTNVAAVRGDKQQQQGATPVEDASPEQPSADAAQQHLDVDKEPEAAAVPTPAQEEASAAATQADTPAPAPDAVVPEPEPAGQDPAAAVLLPKTPADAVAGPQQGPAAAVVERPFAAAPEPAAALEKAQHPSPADEQPAAVPGPEPQVEAEVEADTSAQQEAGADGAPVPAPDMEVPALDRAHNSRRRSGGGGGGRKLLAVRC